jgi:Na+/phosphate symporter
MRQTVVWLHLRLSPLVASAVVVVVASAPSVVVAFVAVAGTTAVAVEQLAFVVVAAVAALGFAGNLLVLVSCLIFVRIGLIRRSG